MKLHTPFARRYNLKRTCSNKAFEKIGVFLKRTFALNNFEKKINIDFFYQASRNVSLRLNGINLDSKL